MFRLVLGLPLALSCALQLGSSVCKKRPQLCGLVSLVVGPLEVPFLRNIVCRGPSRVVLWPLAKAESEIEHLAGSREVNPSGAEGSDPGARALHGL